MKIFVSFYLQKLILIARCRTQQGLFLSLVITYNFTLSVVCFLFILHFAHINHRFWVFRLPEVYQSGCLYVQDTLLERFLCEIIDDYLIFQEGKRKGIKKHLFKEVFFLIIFCLITGCQHR